MSGVYIISGGQINKTKTIEYKSYSIVLDRIEIGKNDPASANVEIVLLDANGNYIKSISYTLSGTNYSNVINESELHTLINQHISTMNTDNTL